jgi:hypothetical protein
LAINPTEKEGIFMGEKSLEDEIRDVAFDQNYDGIFPPLFPNAIYN